MNFWELKNKIETTGGEHHFFDAGTLKFFGERISDMRVLKNTVQVKDISGEMHTCYVISATRRKNYMGACKPYSYHHYFDTTTYNHVIL